MNVALLSAVGTCRMLYWSVGGTSDAARYIHRTTLDVTTAADSIQQFIDVSSATAHDDHNDDVTGVQDIVMDVRTHRFAYLNLNL